MTQRFCMALVSISVFSSFASARIWYVDDDTPAVGVAQDGTSWDRAFDSLQEGVDAAYFDGVGEVWVAQGVYTSSTDTALVMRPYVDVYAGFLGHAIGGFETARSQRDWAAQATIIDGQGVRRCVTGADDATLDGFILVNGRAVRPPASAGSQGSGVFNPGVSPTIANCLIVNCTAHYGGAIHNYDASPLIEHCVLLANSSSIESTVYNGGAGAPVFSDCVVALNTATYGGSAVASTATAAGRPEFRRCVFAANKSELTGGAMHVAYGSSLVANCLFIGNAGPSAGAAYVSRGATAVFANCTFDRNRATTNAGALVTISELPGYVTTSTVTNCILWKSSPAEIYAAADPDTILSVTYSDVLGGHAGEGNLNPPRNPRFVGGPSGYSTAFVYDTARYKTILTHAGAGFQPNTLAGAILWTTHDSQDMPYFITANDAESITVWGDATQGGAVPSPVAYAVIDYHLADDSPCVDTGRDTSGTEFGEITGDLNGEPRGQDGAWDGPTGPPSPGDGSDYDMGAFETVPVFHPADIDRSGSIDAVDVQLVINQALGIATGMPCDIDRNGAVDAVDVQLVINAALGLR